MVDEAGSPPGFPDTLVLASASPRRRELLERLGVAVDVRPADIDETPHDGEGVDALVERLAREKVQAVARPGEVVVGADTMVSVDSMLLGKPIDDADAARMLRLLSGRTHDVVTGLAVAVPRRGLRSLVVRTRVVLVELSDQDIAWYVASGEPLDKAGAYAHQSRAARFVERVEGSQTSVIGLPLAELASLLAS